MESDFEKEKREEKYDCTIDEDRALLVISTALRQRENAEEIELPEEHYYKFLCEQGLDERQRLNALFLTSTMILQSRTGVFLDRLSNNPDNFSEYAWIFEPSEVVQRGEKETKETCKKYLVPMGRQQNALEGWYHNCEVLHDKYDDDIRNFFQKHDNDAEKIWKALYVGPRVKTWQKEFRRLGPKLSALFLQWVGKFDLYPLENIDTFGLPVDIQIARIAVQTGIVNLNSEIDIHHLTFNILLPLITKLCKEMEWRCRDVSEALWLLGSEGCSKRTEEIEETCPLRKHCTQELVPSKTRPRKLVSETRI